MNKPLNFTVQLLIVLAYLQVAFLGLLVNDRRGEAVSANSFRTIAVQNALAVGNRLPPFSYDNRLGEHLSGGFSGRAATLIFGGCECQTERMKALADAAVKRHELAMFFIQDAPQHIDVFKRQYHVSEPVRSIRIADEYVALNTKQFPLVVHLSSDGTIVGLEH